MKIVYHPDVISDDLKDLLAAISKGVLGVDKHRALARPLLDTQNQSRMNARIQIVANCIDCAVPIERAIETIWHRGSPVSITLVDGTCPRCNSKAGFKYASAKSLYA